MNPDNKKLAIDAVIFFIFVALSFYLINSGILSKAIDLILPINFVPEIISGILFTSFLTAPLFIATIYILTSHINPIQIALLGALGAAIADLFIIKLFRDNLFKDFHTLSMDLKLQKLKHFFVKSHFNHLAPVIGLLIIASPFPDEIGLMLLGATKLKNFQLFILTYILNAVGILILAISSNFFN